MADPPLASTSPTPPPPPPLPSTSTPRDSISSLPPLPVRSDDYASSSSEDEDDDLIATGSDALLSDKHRQRTDSIGSIRFDFNSNLLLAASSEERSSERRRGGGGRNGNVDEPIGITAGIALIVGMQVGSGIFSSPGVVAKETGAVGSALILWVGAGLLSWAGASSFAELGSALPLNGGAQAYLDAAFGPLPAYCFSFTAVTALKPGSQAIIAIIFGEYLCRLIYHTAFSVDPNVAARGVPTIAIKTVAILALFLVSALQAWSAKAGTRAQLVLTVFKVFALVLVFVGGLVFLGLGRAASDFSFTGSSDSAAGYALALFSALWTFDGWDQCNYVAKDCAPGTLPVIINSSLATVVVLFLAANASYFLVLPFATATATSTIGLDFGRTLLGPIGGFIFALIVSISCLGALNGSLYTSSRLIVAAAEQGFLPKFFKKYNERQETPINGILLSSGLSALFVVGGDFAHLTLFYGCAAWVWNFAVVVGLLVLRVREPSLKRPYRTWLSTPILFASTALFLIILSIFSKPFESLAAFVFCSAGAVPYYIQNRRQRASEAKEVGLEMT